MKTQKTILSLLMVSGVLYGCGGGDDNNNNSVETSTLQAFDGPVRGMIATISCDDNTSGSYQHTNDEGNISIPLATFVTAPETCSVELNGDDNAVDMDNGKDLSGVTYKAPKGLFSAGQKATASPLTTLITTSLDGAAYIDSTAIDIFQDLGLGDITNNGGVSVKELLTDTQGTIRTLENANSLQLSKLIATNHVLSDIIATTPNTDASTISRATNNLSEVIITQYPNFPKNNNTTTPKEIYFDFRATVNDTDMLDKLAESTDVTSTMDNFPDIKNIMDKPIDAFTPDPTDPNQPTGTGTGTGSSNGGGNGV